MDQLMCASLSHTHYWYEVGMLIEWQCSTSEVASMYGHTYGKSMDQPGKVANPARGQLNRENVRVRA